MADSPTLPLTPPASCQKAAAKNGNGVPGALKKQEVPACRAAPAPLPVSSLPLASSRQRRPENCPSSTPSKSAISSGAHPRPARASLACAVSLQQEPGAADYLARLLRLVQCRSVPLSSRASSSSTTPPKSGMADFLASFNLGAPTPAPSNNLSCLSVEDLQMNLRHVLESKVTTNRAEHVSIMLEIRASAQFTLLMPENGDNSIDPLLGATGATPTPGPADQPGGNQQMLTRVVGANETLMNQPQDDPSLQRAVAKHIIAAITEVTAVDGSAWAVREVSRISSGWTFTYLCKNSYQQWSRQNAKNPTKAIVGEYSLREPDPTLSTRPAFDCRGCIVIAFNRNSRAITVKYDHTPLHMTVAQLSAYFKPPERELGPGARKALQQKTPKTPKRPKSDKRARESTSKKAQDENGNPRKRKKKNNGAAQPDPAQGPIIPPDLPNAMSTDGQDISQLSSYTNAPQAPQVDGQNRPTFNDYPQGLIGQEAAGSNGSHTATSQPPASSSLSINVSAVEAARRKEVATTLLSSSGVDPTTLSTEQFGIFSNQAPDLQKESLAMLVRYGAERLRIVHPSNREGSASASASGTASPTQTSQATPSGPTTTKELVPQSQSNDVSTDGANGASGKRTKKGAGKSRTACFSCKSRKVKCPKQRPTCTECQTSGFTCEYAPPKPRKSKAKSDAVVIDEDEEEQEEESGLGEDAPGEPSQHPEENQQDQEYSQYPQIPVSDMLTPSIEQTTHEHPVSQPSYFQSGSGLILPQAEVTTSIAPHSLHGTSGIDNGHQHGYNSGIPQQHEPAEQPPTYSQQKVVSPRQRKGRRSLPAAPSHSTITPIQPPQPQPATVPTASPRASRATTGRQRTRQSNSRSSADFSQRNLTQQAAVPTSNTNIYQGMSQPNHTQAASSVPQATRQVSQPHHSPTVAAAVQAAHRTSPFQAADVPRTASRTSQRVQNRTPAGQSSVRGYPPPASNEQTPSAASVGRNTGGTGTYSDHSTFASNTASSSNQYGEKSNYESYSRQQTSPVTRSSRPETKTSRNAAIAMSMASQAPSTTSYAPSSNQWSSSDSSSSHSYNTNTNSTSYNSHATYNTRSSSSTTAPPSQGYNLRRSSNQSSYGNQSSQQQQQNYPSYTSQTAQEQNQSSSNQHPVWYNYNNQGNTGFTPANIQSSGGYSWKMPDEGWGGV